MPIFIIRNAFELALKLENMGRSGNLSNVPEIFEQFSNEVEELKVTLESLINEMN